MTSSNFPAPQVVQQHNEPTSYNDLAPSQQLLEELNSYDHSDKAAKNSAVARWVHRLSGGMIQIGESEQQLIERELIEQIQLPTAPQVYFIGVFSQKGGVGKTTATATIGSVLAQYRSDQVIALDTNPDGGSLGIRVPQRRGQKSILDLRDAMYLRDIPPVEFEDFVSKNPQTGLSAITMPPGEKPKHPLSSEDFNMLVGLLRNKYPYKFVLVDCGTNLTSEVMNGILPTLDLIINVATTAADEAAVTFGGMDAIAMESPVYEDLIDNSITILNDKMPRITHKKVQARMAAQTETLYQQFADNCRAVVQIPRDDSLIMAGKIDMDYFAPNTKLAYMQVAAEIVQALREKTGWAHVDIMNR